MSDSEISKLAVSHLLALKILSLAGPEYTAPVRERVLKAVQLTRQGETDQALGLLDSTCDELEEQVIAFMRRGLLRKIRRALDGFSHDVLKYRIAQASAEILTVEIRKDSFRRFKDGVGRLDLRQVLQLIQMAIGQTTFDNEEQRNFYKLLDTESDSDILLGKVVYLLNG